MKAFLVTLLVGANAITFRPPEGTTPWHKAEEVNQIPADLIHHQETDENFMDNGEQKETQASIDESQEEQLMMAESELYDGNTHSTVHLTKVEA